MSQFIAIPLKKTSEVDLVKPIQQLITNYYANNEKNYNESIEQLNKLRKDATFKGIEGKSTTTLSALQRYYDQLKLFVTKCPSQEVPIAFKWKDAFDESSYSFLSSSSSLIIQSFAYERICVLFNLAASYSDVAATALNEDVHNEHALQLAAKYFQLASGIFLSLKSDVPAALGQRCTHSDLNPSILDILHYLMLAQAQEAIFCKATQNNMSDASLSKLASQCSDYYAECYKLIQIIKSIWPAKDWFNQIYAKQMCYSAISDFHQAAVTEKAQKFGEEIAWLNHAIDLFKQAETKSSIAEYLQTYSKKIIRRQENAVKENDFIYHARVPEYRLLDTIERYSLVKPAAIPDKFLPESADLFDGLSPLDDLAYVGKMIDELPVLLKRNTEILNEIEQSIKNEEARDNTQREKFGKDKWTRTASNVLNKAWKDYVEKYRNIVKNAMEADEKVKEKFKTHEREITSMSNEARSNSSLKDLLRHVQEGIKFYNDLTQLLVSLQTKVDDYCFARKTELEELIKNIESGGKSGVSKSHTSAPKADSSSSTPAASAPPTVPPGQPAYFAPPPLPSMPYGAPYGTYHPGYMAPYPTPHPNYYAPQSGYPYNFYHTLPNPGAPQQPDASGQQQQQQQQQPKLD